MFRRYTKEKFESVYTQVKESYNLTAERYVKITKHDVIGFERRNLLELFTILYMNIEDSGYIATGLCNEIDFIESNSKIEYSGRARMNAHLHKNMPIECRLKECFYLFFTHAARGYFYEPAEYEPRMKLLRKIIIKLARKEKIYAKK